MNLTFAEYAAAPKKARGPGGRSPAGRGGSTVRFPSGIYLSGALEGVTISNLCMIRSRGGIFLRLGNRARPYLASGPGRSGCTLHHPEPYGGQ
jgi:hypothetical protein